MTVSGKLQLLLLNLRPAISLVHHSVFITFLAISFLGLFGRAVDDGFDEQRQIGDRGPGMVLVQPSKRMVERIFLRLAVVNRAKAEDQAERQVRVNIPALAEEFVNSWEGRVTSMIRLVSGSD